ncbi:Nucleolar GTP-binding protein 1 [Clydaea vesicula]|uniref:Nucleolar GTP-binding protein 1 n=1 Tax=Clydaea vesicula TaxID=447962 RepID=A0AAD5U3V8_9FUNG|nr:Nucleolar GTP-binding protein 1 [Clydaea vesicula]
MSRLIPTGPEFIDIVLSKIQRKTPTVIHPNYKISRIRAFYMRKCKFAQDCFDEKLGQILTDFPKLDEIHPFYADLMNVLYDRDHYKLALGQINTARHLIDNVAKDYTRLLKFADSLYRCKQLKRAALGRMATIMKRQKDSLQYLEQVRQHLARLPSIDPNTRTLLVCGYPNVGKSSFMNKLTRAEVEVQPYAFTTKSLFVGHMDYKYLRWQVIDTPGILDHPLEQRNTIEMQSVTAMAHLRCCILFFMDLSEQCGYSVAEQCKLYHSIKALFVNKPTMLVINKIDVMRPDQLNSADKALIDQIVVKDNIPMVQLSCFTEEGVMDVRNMACDTLLAARVEQKMKNTNKMGDVINKLHLTTPAKRDDKERPAFIPEGVKNKIKYDTKDPNRKKLEKDLEVENGGAGVYNVDLKKLYKLENDEWKYDIIPEIMDGKNVADFIDPDIEEKLAALEEEEERLISQGFYNSDSDLEMDTEVDIRSNVREPRPKKVLDKETRSRLESRMPRKRTRSVSQGVNIARSQSVGTQLINNPTLSKRAKTSMRSQTRDRSVMGLSSGQKEVSLGMKAKTDRKKNLLAKAGEADRTIQTKMPKHLFAGKRGFASDRR